MQCLSKKTTLAIVISCLFLGLVGCHRDNPLLADENLSKIQKGMWWVYGVGDDVGPCSTYYADPTLKPELKARCEAWIDDLYQKFVRDGTINHNISLADFKDPALWKIIQQPTVDWKSVLKKSK